MKFHSLKTGTFLRNVMTVLTGSVLAQLISLLAAPLLARMFTPEQFGILSLYVGAITLLGVVSTLRYENAVLLPASFKDAASVVAATVFCTLAFSVLFTVCLAIAKPYILSALGLSSLSELWFLLPVGVCLMGLIQAMNIWQVRTQNFGNQAIARISQTGTTAGLQLVFGLLHPSAIGLLLGQLFGQLANILILLFGKGREHLRHFRELRFTDLWHSMRTYQRFPKYSLLADAANALSNHLPYLLLGIHFGPAVVGLYALTQRVLNTPVSMVGSAVLDVFKERAATDYKNTGNCRPIFRRTAWILTGLAVPPSALLLFFAPELFSFIFGANWHEAGVYASILSPLLCIRFIASPLGYVLYISQKQHIDMIWQIVLLIITVVAITLGTLADDARYSITLFSLGYSVMSLVYIGLSYYHAKEQ